jgi:hypothetical protein
MDASYQVSVQLAKRFQKRRISQSETSVASDPLTNMATTGNSYF